MNCYRPNNPIEVPTATSVKKFLGNICKTLGHVPVNKLDGSWADIVWRVCSRCNKVLRLDEA